MNQGCQHEQDALALAQALQAHVWLEEHANTAIGAPGYIPEADRCLHCCRFAAEVIRGTLAFDILHMRCDQAQVQYGLLEAGHRLAGELVKEKQILGGLDRG